MADASTGVLAQMSADAPGTAVGSHANPMEFVSENIQKRGTNIDTSGIRGSRSHASERTVAGPYTVGGQIVFAATPTLLDYWLPKILGTAESADSFVLAETIPYFDLLIDRVAKRFVYGNCKVAKATFSHQSGQPLMMALDIVGQSETVSATAFPALTAPTDPPYAFSQLVGTLVSSARIIKSIQIVIDNALEARFSNSQTATSIMPTDRLVTLGITTPYTSTETDLYAQTLLGSAGSAVWTNGGLVTTFTFGKLQAPDLSPVVGGKGEIDLIQEYVARKTGSTMELAMTHDSAP